MRTLVLAAVALTAIACTSSSHAPHPQPSRTIAVQYRWHATSEQAIMRNCPAYTTGRYEAISTGIVQQEWHTKAQDGRGLGQIARLSHSPRGYRMIKCTAVFYTHG